MMKKLTALLAVVMLLCAAWAETDADYGRVEMTDTLETVVQKLNEPAWTQEGYADFGGVLCAFYESGRLQAKAVKFDDIHAVAMATEVDFAPVRKLRQGTSIESVREIMGSEGTEIVRINPSDEENSGVMCVLAWKKEDGSVMQTLFEMEDGKWVLFAAVENIENEGK